MVTKTSLSALRALLFIARNTDAGFLSPRRIAEALGESPTYLAKVTRELVKAGILRVERGVKGGVRLSRPPAQISLLHIVEACQGTLVGDYCQPGCDLSVVCSYHAAAAELHAAISEVLSRWTLAQLLHRPASLVARPGGRECVMLAGVSPAVFSGVLQQIAPAQKE